MKSRGPLYLGVVLVVIAPFAVGEGALSQGAGGSSFQQRSVSPPAAASDELRTAIEASGVPSVELARSTVPKTREQWIVAQSASSQASLEELAARRKVVIEAGSVAGVAVFHLTPNHPSPKSARRLFLHLHGGGYVYNGGSAASSEAALISGTLGVAAISVDYRMPPVHPFPAAVDDSVAVYRELLKSYRADQILIGGTSAGGGLALASVHRIRSLGLELPAAVYAGTPWADLTKTGDTLYTNEGIDRVLVTYDGTLEAAALLYANGEDLKAPLLSPVYGNFEGFPPTILFSGTRDMFLSDTVRVHRKLRSAGVEADLHVFEAVSHADYLIVSDSPETNQMLEELGRFLDRHLP